MIVTFAYCYESASFLIKVLKDTSVVCVEDPDCEQEDSETEKSQQKEGKLFISYEMRSNMERYAARCAESTYRHPKNSNFSSFDYSQMIYTPPDLA